jgi:hypothetical protein
MSDFVRQWQLALLTRGHDLGPAGADGDFGSATLRASLKELGEGQVHQLASPVAFFTALRSSFGSLSQGQVDGANALLKAMERWPISWVAYGFATAWHETARTLQPIKEMGGEAYFKRLYDIEGSNPNLAKRLGNHKPGDGARYAGRGYVQLTGRDNYYRYGIADDPDRALDPAVAAQIMVDGMEAGRFTGKKLNDYLPGDYVNARRIINGTDKAVQIAGYAKVFETALTAGGWS